MTVNDVRDGVINTLDAHFPDMRIYGEEIKQGFQEPCFFIALFPVQHAKEFGRRYKRMHSFDIHYFPAVAELEELANQDMHDMADLLYDRLEMIHLQQSVIRGHNMRHEIINGVLHFFVDYDFHLLRSRPSSTKMQQLNQEGIVK